ncbi:primosomal protein N' [candidate division TA06 bacterium]|uniref:Replication restart protein PriA n=1 Tax=candidate division TA06 bacterium TaxID=2250710 RepID=A0A933ICM4_UNCT6|nr:primosomal protein N' [candidate division TA06 bacterium]
MSSTNLTYAEVALPLPGSSPFTYEVPEELAGRLCPGMRVRVPLGSREMMGYVVAISKTTSHKTKPILEAPDQEPVITKGLLELTRWAASYYGCAWGEAIRAALPPGLDARQKALISIRKGAVITNDDPESTALLQLLEERGEIAEKFIHQRFGPSIKAVINRLMAKGSLERRLAWQKNVKPRLQRWLAFNKTEELPARALKQRSLLEKLSREKEIPPSGLLNEQAAAAALVKKGLARWEGRRSVRLPRTDYAEKTKAEPALTDEQSQALKLLSQDLEQSRFRVNLIHGVTGSGKTELYLQAARQAVKLGRSVLMLVPEIGLTPQMISRAQSKLGQVALWHSGMSQGERLDAWESLRREKVRMVVGTRSAVFAPLKDLGLIVVDEEHDSSYKQSEVRPYYHARDLAIVRAKAEGASVILGSATPSVESYYKAAAGKFRLFLWEKRAGNSLLPQVVLVDLKSQLSGPGLISAQLEKAIGEALGKNNQVMLLLNRRGFAPYVQCRCCGQIVSCPNCSISLTYHLKGHRMLCHYCGYSRLPLDSCPACHSGEFIFNAKGVQGLEEELGKKFPRAGLLRMDTDTTGRKGAHQNLLQRFYNREAMILLGTQMIAKGHDFPDVSLVGIINVDDILGLPDFRSQERAFQLVSQMAGRAGRGERPGLVIVQTRLPANPVMACAKNHDYQGFWKQEINDRREHGYPPFTHLALVTVTAGQEQAGMSFAGGLAKRAQEIKGEAELLGPVPSPVFRLKGRYRWQLLIKAPRPSVLQAVLKKLALPLPPGVKTSIEIDPVSLF